MSEIACVQRAEARVGESPLWVPEEQALYWVEIYKPALHRLDPATGATREWPMPEPIGCIALRQGGGMIAGMRSGFAFVDLDSGAVTQLHNPEPDQPGNRLNDGRCDRAGRFFAGSMVETLDRPDGALHRFDPDRKCHRIAGDLICSNGLAWSPDDRVMYHSDSPRSTVFAYDYDIATGAARNRRVFATMRPGEGRPDGAAVDEEGCYWSARYDGWRIVRHAPDGREIETIKMPAQNVTMCAFGGPKLNILYVTTARGKLAAEQLAKQPLAGSVFALEVKSRGLKEPRFAG